MAALVALLALPAAPTFAIHTRNVAELRVSLLDEREAEANARELLAEPVLTRERLREVALLLNPAIRAAAAEANAAEGAVREAMLLDNPSLLFEERDLPTDSTSTGESTSFIALRKPIAIPGRRSAQREVALSQMGALFHRYEAIRNDVLFAVDQGVYIQLGYRELLVSTSRHLALVDQLVREARSPLDRQRLLLESERLALEITRLTAEQVRAASVLQVALGGVSYRADRIGGDLPRAIDFSLTDITTTALVEGYHPVLAAQSEVILRSDQETALRRSVIADPMVMMGVGRDRRTNESFVEAGVEIPLPVFDRRQGSRAESLQRIAAAEAQLRDTENSARSRIGWLRQQINETDTLAQVYRDELIPLARAALDSAMEEYRAGRLTLTEFFDVFRQSLDVDRQAVLYAQLLGELLSELRAIRGFEMDEHRR